MKRKRFSVGQIGAIVKQAETALPVAELIRRVGISEQTFYRWKKQSATWKWTRYGSSSSSRMRTGG